VGVFFNLIKTAIGMKNFGFQQAFILFRAICAGLVCVHGFTRLFIGGIPIFGQWLSEQGFPLGTVVAGGITFFEIIGGLLLIFGRYAKWIAPIFMLELLMGVIMVHAQHGWFVVGVSFNGVEYSLSLINGFFLIWAMDYFKGKE
jgi:putative oxidoreductase